MDFLAQPSPLSNLERQWAYRFRKRVAKRYHRCRHCNRLLMRMNDGVKVFSPTNNPSDAFCHDRNGICKNEFLKTIPTERVVKLDVSAPQPLDISLLETAPVWDKLRGECDTAGTRPQLRTSAIIKPGPKTVPDVVEKITNSRSEWARNQ